MYLATKAIDFFDQHKVVETSISQVPAHKLASAVLEELPGQLAGYYNAYNLAPINELSS